MAWEAFEWLGWPGMGGDKPLDVWAGSLEMLRSGASAKGGARALRGTADVMAAVVQETRRVAPKHLFVPCPDEFGIDTPAPGSWSVAVADPVLRAIKNMHAVFADRFARRPFLVELLKPLFTVLEARPDHYLTDPAALSSTRVCLPRAADHDRLVYAASFYEAGAGDVVVTDGVEATPLTIEDHRDGSVAISATCTESAEVLHIRCTTLRPDVALPHAGDLIRIAFLDTLAGGWYRDRIRQVEIEDLATGDVHRMPYQV